MFVAGVGFDLGFSVYFLVVVVTVLSVSVQAIACEDLSFKFPVMRPV